MSPILYLASQSPRRIALLDQIGVAHQQLSVAVDETRQANESAEDYVIRLAIAKAKAGWQRLQPKQAVLAADTSVVIEDRILGKPLHQQDAKAMLLQLSAKTHRVLTGVAVLDQANRLQTRLSESQVCFRPIGADEADWYWQSGEPMDKAGGYAIQGLGAIFVQKLTGSFSGVMGLPLFETAELLDSIGIPVLPQAKSG